MFLFGGSLGAASDKAASLGISSVNNFFCGSVIVFSPGCRQPLGSKTAPKSTGRNSGPNFGISNSMSAASGEYNASVVLNFRSERFAGTAFASSVLTRTVVTAAETFFNVDVEGLFSII